MHDLRRAGVGALGGLLLAALAALILGGTQAGLLALERQVQTWRDELRLVAILGEVSGGRAVRREDRVAEGGEPSSVDLVRALPGVAEVRYVSSGEALNDLRRYVGATQEGWERLSANPIPARLVVTPDTRLRPIELAALMEAVGRVPGVDEVEAPFGWLDPAERVARGLRTVGLGLGSLLALGALAVMTAATALAARRKAEEAAVLRLAGVGESRLWMPLVAQAALQGAVGAALGVGVLWLLSQAAPPWTGPWVDALIARVAVPPPSGRLTLALVGGGLSAGAAAGLLAGRP